jgi:hypothetical protein
MSMFCGCARQVELRGLLVLPFLLPGLWTSASAQEPVEALPPVTGSYVFVASVFDAVTGEPVEAAFAAAMGTEQFGVSDRNGSFRVEGIPEGQHVIKVWRLGYQPTMFTVRFDSLITNVLDVPIVLQPIPVQMPEVVVEADRTRLVTGPMRQFYQRRGQGLGWFMTRQQIQERAATEFTDIIRLVPGADIQYLGNLQSTIRLAPTCGPVYFLDGVMTNERLVMSLEPEHLQGIEVYNRVATVPPEFNVMGSSCGVIVVWTYH